MSGAPTPTSHPSSPRPVLIAGGGIGGMATALTLHQIGVPCIVFESVSYTHLTLPTTPYV